MYVNLQILHPVKPRGFDWQNPKNVIRHCNLQPSSMLEYWMLHQTQNHNFIHANRPQKKIWAWSKNVYRFSFENSIYKKTIFHPCGLKMIVLEVSASYDIGGGGGGQIFPWDAPSHRNYCRKCHAVNIENLIWNVQTGSTRVSIPVVNTAYAKSSRNSPHVLLNEYKTLTLE